MVYLTRRYRFSASHRLHNGRLTPQENFELYGKCNNPHGHGHNYVVEVTLAGPIDPVTGMVFDLGTLDATVAKEVLARFDETNLNLDAENFKNRVPTTENLCVELYRLLHHGLRRAAPRTPARLERVRLEETNSNFFEYAGESEGRRAARNLKGGA